MDTIYKCVPPGVQPEKKHVTGMENSGGAGKHTNSMNGKGEEMEWGKKFPE